MNGFIYAIQIGFIAKAIFNAYEEVAFTWPFREITFYTEDPEQDKKIKEKLSKDFHTYGAFRVATMLLLVSSSTFFIYSEFNAMVQFGKLFIYFFVAGSWYWLIFDIAFAKLIKQAWYYLGNSNGTDVWLKEALGPEAGQWKAAILLGVIFLLNFANIQF